MTMKELDRSTILNKIVDKRLKQVEVANLWGISSRQVKRLLKLYRQEGPAGLVSKKKGRFSNHRLPDILKEHVIGLLKVKYSDFGPLLAQGKQAKIDHLKISAEPDRNLLISKRLWASKKPRRRESFNRGKGEAFKVN